ncbi:MAG: ABC transporter ATP-binding protein [Candidatus Marinimicrobia bacterium]|nr:ABC transporter ATP-binding protein [Candidatus Neomarinimicrobiota bacterium]
MIEFKNISKSFSSKDILNNISFKIKTGESVAIIGQSGEGKSVLLKHFNGLMMPDSGQVIIDKKIINELSFSDLQLVRKNMSMVFQFGALFDSLSIKDNILISLDNNTSLDTDEKEKRVIESLDLVNLSHIDHLYLNDLSGGMKKRVGISRAISIRPTYILYDEPTTGLDPINTGKIIKLMQSIKNSKKITSIIVTHEMKIVNEFVSRVIMLKNGNIIFDGSPKDLNSSKDKYIKSFILGKE